MTALYLLVSVLLTGPSRFECNLCVFQYKGSRELHVGSVVSENEKQISVRRLPEGYSETVNKDRLQRLVCSGTSEFQRYLFLYKELSRCSWLFFERKLLPLAGYKLEDGTEGVKFRVLESREGWSEVEAGGDGVTSGSRITRSQIESIIGDIPFSEGYGSSASASEKPKEGERRAGLGRCPVCGGEGEVQCDYCDGAGETWVPCPNCEGSGELVCEACNGRGSVRCGKCGGSGGITRYTLAGDYITRRCQVCGGDGRVRCNICRGKGKVRCPRCGGGGKVWGICPTCRGEGVVPCPECDGEKPARAKGKQEEEGKKDPGQQPGKNYLTMTSFELKGARVCALREAAQEGKRDIRQYVKKVKKALASHERVWSFYKEQMAGGEEGSFREYFRGEHEKEYLECVDLHAEGSLLERELERFLGKAPHMITRLDLGELLKEGRISDRKYLKIAQQRIASARRYLARFQGEAERLGNIGSEVRAILEKQIEAYNQRVEREESNRSFAKRVRSCVTRSTGAGVYEVKREGGKALLSVFYRGRGARKDINTKEMEVGGCVFSSFPRIESVLIRTRDGEEGSITREEWKKELAALERRRRQAEEEARLKQKEKDESGDSPEEVSDLGKYIAYALTACTVGLFAGLVFAFRFRRHR